MDRLIAIDASLTNTAVCDYCRGGAYAMHCFVSESAGTGMARIGRYSLLCKQILNVISDDDSVFLEGYSFASPNRSVHIAEFGGILREQITRTNSIIEVPPTTLKLFTLGKGVGDKTAMTLAAFKRWGVEFKTNDEVDAFALAKLGAQVFGWEQPENDAQRRAVDSVLGLPKKSPKKKSSAT